jgi:hypothetical protein
MRVCQSIRELCGSELELTFSLTGRGFHPFQILFARMGITVVCSSIYMWRSKTEHFPFGLKAVRPLLIARGLTGFFGVFGMYCKSTSLRTFKYMRCHSMH